ncbi:exopolysaccharide biosynthesis polyprenyl glycosylphosphotransferase [Nocardioides plantarum]|uniref:Exopolysaccharide biosynthesis polyprenyl glycosylphosphotransferase n=2 Tax=Nocardioides plantarum TaxID=29299 RepID=A0ABV5K520_9ACTN|nr:exopolysaccharide biosynthesis polyprenyl glycosylphosphotransferase [Nocardioides plantarum]
MLLLLGVDGPVLLAVTTAMVVMASSLAHLHRSKLVLSVLDDLPRMTLTTGAVVVGYLALVPRIANVPEPTMARAATAAALFLTLLVTTRAVVYGMVNRRRRARRIAHPAIIVGTDVVAVRITEALRSDGAYGLQPVGMVGEVTSETGPLPSPHLGGVATLPRAIVDLGVRDIVFAFSGPPDAAMVKAVRHAVEGNHQVFVVPRFFETMGRVHQHRTEVIHDIALTRLVRLSDRSIGQGLKRGLDVTLAAIALLLLAPTMTVLAVLARRETGAAIHRQTRVGLRGRRFSLYKFQTLMPVSDDEGAVTWNIDNDARLGSAGRFMRRTGLDELPQLVNVLRGDMSLVGPRPERPHFVAEFARRHDRYEDRHRVRTGITGWAQVHDLRGDTSISERVRFDNSYIDNWSLWRDITILARTLPTLRRPQPQSRDVVTAALAAAGPVGSGRPSTAPLRR